MGTCAAWACEQRPANSVGNRQGMGTNDAYLPGNRASISIDGYWWRAVTCNCNRRSNTERKGRTTGDGVFVTRVRDWRPRVHRVVAREAAPLPRLRRARHRARCRYCFSILTYSIFCLFIERARETMDFHPLFR
jgi:hypothetical protein